MNPRNPKYKKLCNVDGCNKPIVQSTRSTRCAHHQVEQYLKTSQYILAKERAFTYQVCIETSFPYYFEKMNVVEMKQHKRLKSIRESFSKSIAIVRPETPKGRAARIMAKRAKQYGQNTKALDLSNYARLADEGVI